MDGGQTVNVDLSTRFPNASASFLALNRPVVAPRVLAEKSEPSRGQTLVRQAQPPKAREPGVAIIVTRCSDRSLDRDNLWSSVKPLVDALREAGYIPNDTEQDIELFVFQKKVPRKESGTLVEIVPL